MPMTLYPDDTLKVLINQVEYINILANAANTKDFKKRVLNVLATFGFSDFALLHTAGPLAAFTLHTLPKELTATYVLERYHHYDLAIDYIASGEIEPFFQSDFQRIVHTASLEPRIFRKNKEIFKCFKEHDIHDVIYIPSGATLTGDKDEEYQEREAVLFTCRGMQSKDLRIAANRCRPLLETLADAIVYLGKKKFLPPAEQPPIKAKSLQLLAMMAKNNVTVKQAADRLFISLDTANKRMSAAKQAFNTKSQVNAVYIAIKNGLISLKD